MTIIGTDSAAAWAPQVGPGADGDNKLVALNSTTWRWHPLTTLAFAPQQSVQPLPQELSGVLLPRGVYKGGVFAAGNISMIPRFRGSHLHWLLWSTLGSMTVLKTQKEAVEQAGVFDYIYGGGNDVTGTWDAAGVFSPDITSGEERNHYDRYLSFKRLLPPDESGEYRGEAFSDARVAGLTLRFVPNAVATMEAAIVARRPLFYRPTDVMTGGALKNEWNPAYRNLAGGVPGLPQDTHATKPDGPIYTCKGTLMLPTGTPLDLTAVEATIQLIPNMTTPQQEAILGSYYPEASRLLNWAVGVSLTIKKGIYPLYDEIFFGGSTGTNEWSSAVWTGAEAEPFSMVFQSGGALDNTSNLPGEYEFYARKILWQQDPIRTSPNQIVFTGLTGVVLSPGDDNISWFFRVRNDRDYDKNENGQASVGFMKTWPS